MLTQIPPGYHDLPHTQTRPEVLKLLRLPKMLGDQRGVRSTGFVAWNWEFLGPSPIDLPAAPHPGVYPLQLHLASPL